MLLVKDGIVVDATELLLTQWRRKWGFTPKQLADELVGAIRAVKLHHLATKVEEGIVNSYNFFILHISLFIYIYFYISFLLSFFLSFINFYFFLIYQCIYSFTDQVS